MNRNIVRVLPKNGIWKVTYNGTEVSTFSLKLNAIEKGKSLAKSHPPSQLVIHKADGTIETEYTYGSDPYPPKG